MSALTSRRPADPANPHGFARLGRGSWISPKAVFYNPGRIWIGENCRIDDFCLLSAQDGIEIGDNVHIGCFSYVVGKASFVMEDYCSLSGRVSVYTSNDDFSGDALINPRVPFTNVRSAPVVMRSHAVVGAGSVLMSGVEMGRGAGLGAMSMLTRSIPEFEIWGGSPARFIKARSRRLLELEAAHRSQVAAARAQEREAAARLPADDTDTRWVDLVTR